MKALIMSDTHGWEKEVEDVLSRHRGEVDAVFHCGDSELSPDNRVLENVYTVKGNCDFGPGFPEEIVETVKNTTFFIGHGHLLNVKMTEMNLIYKGEESRADVICYGHTHTVAAVQKNGMVILNPGSLRLPRQYDKGTYVILETDDRSVNVNFYSLDGKHLEDLSRTFLKNG